jgi:hypothetical protein
VEKAESADQNAKGWESHLCVAQSSTSASGEGKPFDDAGAIAVERPCTWSMTGAILRSLRLESQRFV